MATHSNILAWRIPMNRGAWWATAHGVAKRVGHDWASKHSTAQHPQFIHIECSASPLDSLSILRSSNTYSSSFYIGGSWHVSYGCFIFRVNHEYFFLNEWSCMQQRKLLNSPRFLFYLFIFFIFLVLEMTGISLCLVLFWQQNCRMPTWMFCDSLILVYLSSYRHGLGKSLKFFICPRLISLLWSSPMSWNLLSIPCNDLHSRIWSISLFIKKSYPYFHLKIQPLRFS